MRVSSQVQPIATPIARGVAAASQGNFQSAFSAAKALIEADGGDLSILALGDSTGDATNEWVYKFGEWLAAQYPTHSVSYRLWNNTTDVYGAATAISTGSGANTIRIWNASVGGANPVSMMTADNYAGGVIAPDPDLIIWSYGHNLSSADPANILSLDSAYSPWMELVQADLPNACHVLLTQNPNRDDDLYAPRYTMLTQMGSDKAGLTVADSYAKFMAAGKLSSLYVDNIHPSATGTQLYVDALADRWRLSSSTAISTERWLSQSATNMLVNGDFSNWTGAAPASWTAAASATTTKELTIVDGSDPYSLKIEQTGAVQADVRQLLSAGQLANAIAAGVISFGLRRYLPAGSNSTTGGILLEITAGGVVNRRFYAMNAILTEKWHWMFIRNVTIPSNTTSIRIYAYANTVNTPGAIAYFSRAVVVPGRVPRTMA